jgi:hypothetical protein
VSTDRPRASPSNGIAANAQQTETYGIANDGTPLQWETLQPSGSGPWPFVLLIHLILKDFWNKNAPDRYRKALGNLPDT